VPVVDTNVRRVIARVVHGAGDAGPARAAADLADAEALLPDSAGDGGATAARFSAALMELGAVLCVAGAARCGPCPVRSSCAWHAAGRPAYTGPTRPAQRYAGTDRQVRGRLLDVLRANEFPVSRAQLDVAWLTDTEQRDRALNSLLADGLVTQTTDGRFALAGEEN
jgi:A/G-specific adenine glycosylase